MTPDRPGARHIPKVLQHRAQVVDVCRHFGVIRPEGRLVDRQRPVISGPGTGKVRNHLQVIAKAIEETSSVFAIGLFGLLGDGQQMHLPSQQRP